METKTAKLLALPVMARRLNIKPRDLRTAAERGEVPSLKVGDSLLFVPDEVESALLRRAAGEEVRDEK